MHLILKPQTGIKELNKAFSRKFPFLKLQFYKPLDTAPALSYSEHRAPENMKLSELSQNLTEGVIGIDPSKTVAEIEREFRTKYQLTVQVLRKTGEVWIETRQTDNLTLGKQNIIGADASRPIYINFHTLFL